MFIILGYLIVGAGVFVSFVLMGGHMGALYQPFEFTLIGGAALGAYIASSNGASIKLLLEAIAQGPQAQPLRQAALHGADGPAVRPAEQGPARWADVH